MRNNLKSYTVKSPFGDTFFFIQKDKESNKIHFQMDSCETEMSVKQVKELISILKQTILD